MIGFALVWIAQLPFAIAGIWWQKRYGLVTAGYLEWALENWLVLGAQFLFICLWLLITMALAAPLRDRWWLAAAPVFAGLALLLAFLTPYLVPDQRDPDPALAADARRIARATGQEGVDFKVQEIGDLTEAPNAFAAGLGPSRRVVLWDTLLEPPFDREEVRVVIAHEYGHHESEHIWKGLAWYALVSLPIFFVVARVARRRGALPAASRPRRSARARRRQPRRAAVRQPLDAADGNGGRLGRAGDDEDPRSGEGALRGVRRHRVAGPRTRRVGARVVRHTSVDRRQDRRSDCVGAARPLARRRR